MVQEIFNQLGFDWKVALANLVNFFIIYYLLRNIVFKKLGDSINERQEKIKKGLLDAEKAETALLSAETEKDQILKEAYKGAKDITEGARVKGEGMVRDSNALALEEAIKIKEKKLKEAERETLENQKKMERSYAELLVQGMEKVAMQKMDKQASEDFALSLLNQKN